jgi:hypothetical protein
VINAIKFAIEEIEASDQYFDHTTKADMPLRQSLTPFRPLRCSSQCPLFFSTLSWQRRSVIIIETPTQSVRVFNPTFQPGPF